MSVKAETVGTVRERERELHFSNRECGFVQQSDTLCLINNEIINFYIEKKQSFLCLFCI